MGLEPKVVCNVRFLTIYERLESRITILINYVQSRVQRTIFDLTLYIRVKSLTTFINYVQSRAQRTFLNNFSIFPPKVSHQVIQVHQYATQISITTSQIPNNYFSCHSSCL